MKESVIKNVFNKNRSLDLKSIIMFFKFAFFLHKRLLPCTTAVPVIRIVEVAIAYSM